MGKRITFIDLFAGAGGLSEGFTQAGYTPIAHVEMNDMACKSLETRGIYYYLKSKDGGLDLYQKYELGEIDRKTLLAAIPEKILQKIIHENQYRIWINKLKIAEDSIEQKYKETADRHINNCENCLVRMRRGLDLLKKDEKVKVAFQYMNHAMLEQQLHYNLPTQNWILDEKNEHVITSVVSSDTMLRSML